MVAFLSSNPDPQAETLRLDAVSWDNHDELKPEQTPAPFHRPSRRPRRRFQEITTTSGTPVWPLVWLLAAIHPGAVRTTPQLYIDAAELRRLATMVHTVADCCACAECGGTPEETYLYVRPLGASISDRSVLTVCGVLHDWHLVFGIAAGLVTDITLDLAKPLSSLKLACEEDFADLGLDWAALDGQARAFDMSLAYFAVRVPESAYDCDGYLRAHLPKTQACGKLEVMVMPTTRDKGKQRAVGP
ncbi:hypothetical protein PsYK624_128420 [Phanerochaete sordida]|uniref:Uncharacterized protein n=1 Tax=Phanerochaete sordida TaxID=48140 RepID=A0A9P3LJX2_9APHY|nr:hypothetical protein PsYK624_128420 [Phanerochaete sordida]